ncbi:UDP-sugar transporter UST74c-like [Watersipora subatra]|uniref:UDP-sugar transporter UST74c-like n=1 Tax=Watersipora subatra TaxID=2589382 RepID=UPI00355C7850
MAVTELAKRVGSAGFYAICSLTIVVVNKLVLTSYEFPSEVLALGQMTATIIILALGKLCKVVDFPSLSMDTIYKIFPLPLIFFFNSVCGLGGTKRLNLPMFTVLRRFSILMTMLLEQFLLGNAHRWKKQLSVYMMIFGALVAAWYDLSFNLPGYIMIFLSDIATALNGVYTMKKLQAKSLGKYGILFYNSLFMLLPTILFVSYTGGIEQARNAPWMDPVFSAQFTTSCIMGFVLNYSVVLCTLHNSALTTTIVGVMKNIVVTYLGMFIGGDYIFDIMNFVGLNISAAASVVYSYLEFKPSSEPETPEKPPDTSTANSNENSEEIVTA